MKNKTFSIKYRILTYEFALLLPLIIVLGVAVLFQIDETRRQLDDSHKTGIHLIVSLLEQEMSAIENHLYDVALNNRTFRAMTGIVDETDFFTGSMELFNNTAGLFHNYESLTFIAIYHNGMEKYVARDNGLGYLPVSDRISLRRALELRMDRYFFIDSLTEDKWFCLDADGRMFFCRIIRNQGVCYAGMIDLNRLVAILENRYGMENALVFRNGDALLTDMSLLSGIAIQPLESFTFRTSDGRRYMAVSDSVNGITMSYIQPNQGFTGVMSLSSTALVLIAVVIVLMLPLLYRSLRRNFFTPLDRLVETMERIRTGNTEATADEHYGAKEFGMINHTFNQMLGQIRNLKIEQYEQELEARQARFQFLQAQIRPHFYLNCLKTLYSFAKQHQYANIENGILLVSNHLRYAFQQHEDTVPLREELRLCDNYLRLCEIMTESKPELILNVDASAFDIAVPPVSLLTFVENSIRCSLVPEQVLRVTVTAHVLQSEDGSILCLTVHDNGVGFTEEQLIYLNSSSWYENNNDHVGIQNVVRRFRILYGRDFSIAFSNRSGAVQELYLPINSAKKGGTFNEAADC